MGQIERGQNMRHKNTKKQKERKRRLKTEEEHQDERKIREGNKNGTNIDCTGMNHSY